MVEHELLERVMQLNAAERRELRDAIDDSLPAEITPQVAALLDSRVVHADKHPEARVPWETARDRAHKKVAAAKKTA